MKDTGGSESAFPVTYQDMNGQLSIYALGLTKREYIAIAAMQGMISNSVKNFWYSDEPISKGICRNAYQFADDMLAEGGKQ